MEISLKHIQDEYDELLDGSNRKEEVYHQFFIKYPIFLPLWRPYNNVIFSKLKLSTQYEVDFAFARENTPGVTWHFIEIEKPQHKQFTKQGDPTKELRHGLRQIHDWSNWFKINRIQVENYFPYNEKIKEIGLADPEFKLVIGRRENALKNHLIKSFGGSIVDIMSYDRLKENLEMPFINFNEPIKVCSYVNGKIKVLSKFKINYSYTIELE